MCFWIKSKFAPFLFLVVLCHMFNTSFGFSVSNIDHFRVKLVEKCICKLPIKLLALSLDKSIGGGYIYEYKKVRLPYIKWDAGQRILNRIAQGIIYERTRKENKNDSIVWSWKKWWKNLLMIKGIRHDFRRLFTHIIWFSQKNQTWGFVRTKVLPLL